MSKPAKPAAAAAAGDQPPAKSKKMLIIIIAAVVLLAGGGAAAFLMMKKDHPPKAEKAADGEEASAEHDSVDDAKEKLPPKFVEIGTFTANLMHEDADSVIQVAISLKLNKPELEEKVKEYTPEIQNKVNLLLQSKYRSQLATVEGKQKLAQQIKAQIEFVLGLRKTAPEIRAIPPAQVTTEEAASQVAPVVEPETHSKKGIAEVLFTSFIIQ
jgi:flagellar FliL protein